MGQFGSIASRTALVGAPSVRVVSPPKQVPKDEAMVPKAGSCPFTNLSHELNPKSPQGECPFSFHSHQPFDEGSVTVTEEVPLAVRMGTHQTSDGAARLLHDIGGGVRIREFCTRFYARMHEDTHLKQFLFLDDGSEQHGKRLGDWIIEKMGGEGKPWTESGRNGMRQPSHFAAWNNKRRDASGWSFPRALLRKKYRVGSGAPKRFPK